jgi:hypothetical protein
VIDPRLSTFPWPFAMEKESFQYSTNVVPAGTPHLTAAGQWGETVMWIEPDEYRAYTAERNAAFDRPPAKAAALPSAAQAVWDMALFLMEQLSVEHPAHFRLRRDGDEMVWENDLLGIRQNFVYGDDSSLPGGPLDYIGRQSTDDLLLLHEHDGQLWLDATAEVASGSGAFTVGMSFSQLHAPTAVAVPPPVVERAERYLLRMEPGEITRRTSWVFQSAHWGNVPESARPDAHPSPLQDDEFLEAGRNIVMRVEPQHLVKLPRTGHLLFMIRHRFLSLEDLASVPAWARQMLSILENQDPETYAYKGIGAFDGMIERYLRRSLGIEVGSSA